MAYKLDLLLVSLSVEALRLGLQICSKQGVTGQQPRDLEASLSGRACSAESTRVQVKR